jgi:cytochrome P450
MSLAFNPADPAFIANPYPVYQLLRAHAPVVYVPEIQAWVVSRYADAAAALKDPRLGVDSGNATSFKAVPIADPRVAALARMFSRQMLFRDPPEHTRLRGLVNKAFTPKVVQQLQPRMERLVDDLLDRAAERGEMDLIADLAFPLPVTVIAMLLGVPAEDDAKFKAWSGPIVKTVEPVLMPEDVELAAAATVEILDYFRDLVKRKRAAPGDDLISTMIAAEEQGQRLTTDELLANAVLFLVAGHETTVNLIGNGVLALLRHPDELAKLRASPGKIDNAIEEILRYDSPVTNSGRNVQREQSMRGCPMHLGDSITTSLAAANHDPEVNPDPQRFDIERANVQHQSFGGGKHTCLGAPLARVEAQEGIAALLKRFPDLQPSPRGLKYRTIPSFRGMSEYWLRSGALG